MPLTVQCRWRSCSTVRVRRSASARPFARQMLASGSPPPHRAAVRSGHGRSVDGHRSRPAPAPCATCRPCAHRILSPKRQQSRSSRSSVCWRSRWRRSLGSQRRWRTLRPIAFEATITSRAISSALYGTRDYHAPGRRAGAQRPAAPRLMSPARSAHAAPGQRYRPSRRSGSRRGDRPADSAVRIDLVINEDRDGGEHQSGQHAVVDQAPSAPLVCASRASGQPTGCSTSSSSSSPAAASPTGAAASSAAPAHHRMHQPQHPAQPDAD